MIARRPGRAGAETAAGVFGDATGEGGATSTEAGEGSAASVLTGLGYGSHRPEPAPTSRGKHRHMTAAHPTVKIEHPPPPLIYRRQSSSMSPRPGRTPPKPQADGTGR